MNQDIDIRSPHCTIIGPSTTWLLFFSVTRTAGARPRRALIDFPPNPFISLYLLPLTIAAAALPWAYTWVMAAITISCYTLLLFYYVPLPHDHDEHGSEFIMHVSGMWLAFVLSTVLIAWFVVKMGISIRERDKDLALAREQALRNEQIIARERWPQALRMNSVRHWQRWRW